MAVVIYGNPLSETVMVMLWICGGGRVAELPIESRTPQAAN
jgi:hypothetical protein